MTTENSHMFTYTERIELGSAARLIMESVQVPDEKAQATAMQLVEAECGQIARSVAQDIRSSVLAAESEAELVQARASEAQSRLSKAEEEADGGPRHGSWTKVVLWSLFAVACFAAEFILTWTALCFVLNVKRMTVLGVLLGLAPPSGLAVLEIFLARLFEEPWQKMRKAAASGKTLAMNIAMGALLVTLALGNVVMITHLARAREESAKLQRALSDASSAEDPDIDQEAIDRAILLVSLLVSADGAVFLLLSVGEGSALILRSRLTRQVAEARATYEGQEKLSSAAKAKAEALLEESKAADEKAASAAERYRAHCRFLLAEKAAADREKPIAQLIDRAIRHRIPA